MKIKIFFLVLSFVGIVYCSEGERRALGNPIVMVSAENPFRHDTQEFIVRGVIQKFGNSLQSRFPGVSSFAINNMHLSSTGTHVGVIMVLWELAEHSTGRLVQQSAGVPYSLLLNRDDN